METLTLTKTIGYEVTYWDGDRSGHTSVIGLYKNHAIACHDAKGAGYYGADADVIEIEIYTDGENLYKITKLNKYKDVEKEYREKTIASIKSKLTKEELDLLNVK